MGYTPKGGTDVTSQYMPKGGTDVTSHATGNPVMDAVGKISHTFLPALSALPNNISGVLQRREQRLAAQPQPKNVGDVLHNALTDTLGIAPDVLSTAIKPAMEAASYAVPVGKVLKGVGPVTNVLAKGGNRLLQGATQGALQGASQEGATPGSVAGSAAWGGGFNSALGGGMDTLGKVFGFAGKKVPRDIHDLIGGQQENIQNLVNRAHAEMVGHQNLDYAKQNGILDAAHEFTTQGLTSAMQRAKDLASKKEADLQDVLTDAGITAKPSEFLPGLQDIPRKHGLSPDMPEFQQIKNIIEENIKKDTGPLKSFTANAPAPGEKEISPDNLVGALLQELRGDKAFRKFSPLDEYFKTGQPTGTSAVENIIQGDHPISLSAINSLKRVLGANYAKSPVYREMYSHMKNFIENKSDLPGHVKDLNKEAATLMDIKDNLGKNLDAKNIPLKYDPQTIQALQDKVGIQHPQSLNVLLAALGGLGGAALGGATHGLGLGPLAPLIEPILGGSLSPKLARSKEAQEAIARVLSGTYQGGERALDTTHLPEIMRQLGIHLPITTTSQ